MHPALLHLLELYKSRPDLVDAYPEVHNQEYQGLINWAAGVVAALINDSSKPFLGLYEDWYRQNALAITPVVGWPAIYKAAEAARNRQSVSLPLYQPSEANDISEHLPLFALLVHEFDLKRIVELGTRSGNSTLVLLEAARQVGGSVLSMDVEPCLEAHQRVKDAGLDSLWSFWQANDLEVPSSQIPQPIDLLFIDTLHTYTQLKAELTKYAPLVRSGGWIVIHDYVAFNGLTDAVQEYVVQHPSRFRFYPFANQNGLAMLRACN